MRIPWPTTRSARGPPRCRWQTTATKSSGTCTRAFAEPVASSTIAVVVATAGVLLATGSADAAHTGGLVYPPGLLESVPDVSNNGDGVTGDSVACPGSHPHPTGGGVSASTGPDPSLRPRGQDHRADAVRRWLEGAGQQQLRLGRADDHLRHLCHRAVRLQEQVRERAGRQVRGREGELPGRDQGRRRRGRHRRR